MFDDKAHLHKVSVRLHLHHKMLWSCANSLLPMVQVGDSWMYAQKAVIFKHLIHNFDLCFYAITGVVLECEIQRKTRTDM